MITKYIHELLSVHDRVIIPGFGAFLKSKGKVSNLIFNEFIKFNDGQLTNYTADKENISVNQAADIIDEEVKKIKDDLNNGKKIEIEKLGLLYIDDQNRIRFNISADEQKKPAPEKTVEKSGQKDQPTPEVKTDAPKKEPEKVAKKEDKPAEESTDKKEDKKPEEKDDEIIKSISPDNQGNKEEDEEKHEEKPPAVKKLNIEMKPPVIGAQKEKEEKKSKEEKPESPPKVKSTPPPPRPSDKGISSKPRDKVDKKPETTNMKKQPNVNKVNQDQEKKKSNKLLIWLLIILLPLIGLAAWVIIDYENVKTIWSDDSQQAQKSVGMNDDKNKDDKTLNADKQQKDSKSGTDDSKTNKQGSIGEKIKSDAQKTDQDKTTEDAKSATKAKDGSDKKGQQTKNKSTRTSSVTYEDVTVNPKYKFHVITGGFLYKENADNMVSELNKKGYKSGIIGQFNGFYYVSACAFKKKSTAQYEEKELKDQGYGAWLYYYK